VTNNLEREANLRLSRMNAIMAGLELRPDEQSKMPVFSLASGRSFEDVYAGFKSLGNGDEDNMQ
jgi:hypothetical protein